MFDKIIRKLRREPRNRSDERSRLGRSAFPLFKAGLPLDEIVTRLGADPSAIRALFAEWVRLVQLSHQWLDSSAPTGDPKFNHEPNEDWSCCPAHRMQKAARRRSTHGPGPSLAFDRYVAGRMQSPAFAGEYERAGIEIRAIDEACLDLGMSKTDLARSVAATPEAMRQLLTADGANLTLHTVREVLAAVGLRFKCLAKVVG